MMKMMITTALAWLISLCLVSPILAFEDPDNFRGIKWGASPEEARDAIKEQWNKRGVTFDQYGFGKAPHSLITDIEPRQGLYAEGAFLFQDRIGDAVVQMTMRFSDNKFVQAELKFRSGYFSILETAFKERYGAPTLQEDKEVQNKMGAKFLNKEMNWVGPNVRIRLEKYSGTVTDGRATIGQTAFQDSKIKEFKDKSKAAAKDL